MAHRGTSPAKVRKESENQCLVEGRSASGRDLAQMMIREVSLGSYLYGSEERLAGMLATESPLGVRSKGQQKVRETIRLVVWMLSKENTVADEILLLR